MPGLCGLTRNKCKSIAFLLCAILIYLFVTTPDNLPKHPSKSFIYERTIKHENGHKLNVIPKESCPKDLHLYYVKIHKTGSSTFQNILYRLGMRKGLTFALFGCAYGMTYPHATKHDYLFSKPTFPEFKGYDLITDHSVFHPDFYRDYMPNDTKVITMLRHPLQQLQSTFGFWNLPVKFGITNADEAVKTYLTNPGQYEQTRDSFGCPPTVKISQTQNPQSHHLGLKNQSEENVMVIKELIKTLDEKMHLVMILEQFEESLVLFKRLFCLSTKDIIHLNLFSTSFFNRKTYGYDKSNVDYLIEKQRLWSRADYMIYEHFTEKLNKQIADLGQDFKNELQSFRDVKDKVRNFCLESCDLFQSLPSKDVNYVRGELNSHHITITATKWNNDFSITASDCVLMMFETLMYDDAIKAKQWPTVCPGYNIQQGPLNRYKMPHVNPKYCNHSDHFVDNFSWEAVRNSAYFKKSSCLKNF